MLRTTSPCGLRTTVVGHSKLGDAVLHEQHPDDALARGDAAGRKVGVVLVVTRNLCHVE